MRVQRVLLHRTRPGHRAGQVHEDLHAGAAKRVVLILAAVVGGLTSSKRPSVGEKAVLFIDLNLTFKEQTQEDALAGLASEDHFDTPGG